MNFSDISRQIDILIGMVENEIHTTFQHRMNKIIAMYGSLISDYAPDGELDNLNKYNRLNKMIKQLEQDITQDYSAIAKLTQYAQMMAFIHATVGSAFILSALVGVLPVISFPLLRKLRIDLSQELEENELTNVLGRHRSDMLREIKIALRSSTNDEVNPTDTKRKLKRIRDKYTYTVQRLSTYEIGRAESTAAVDISNRFEDKGSKLERIWISQRDERVRSTHVVLDGQKADDKGLFYSKPTKTRGTAPRKMKGIGMLQENMGCRCSVGYRVNGIELDYMETDNLSPEHRELYEKTSFDKYQEWLKANQENISPAYYKQLSKGMAWDSVQAAQDYDLYKVLDNDLFGDAKKFQQMLKRGFHKKKDGSWGY